MVTVFAAVVVPTVSLPKAKVAGESVTGAAPVPVRLTSCGEFAAVSLMVIAPEMLPVAVGVNVEVMVQEAPALSVAPQVLVSAKSPLDVIVIAVFAEPVFFTATVLPALVVPTACEVNVKAGGVTVTVTTVPVPVPVRLTV